MRTLNRHLRGFTSKKKNLVRCMHQAAPYHLNPRTHFSQSRKNKFLSLITIHPKSKNTFIIIHACTENQEQISLSHRHASNSTEKPKLQN